MLDVGPFTKALEVESSVFLFSFEAGVYSLFISDTVDSAYMHGLGTAS